MKTPQEKAQVAIMVQQITELQAENADIKKRLKVIVSTSYDLDEYIVENPAKVLDIPDDIYIPFENCVKDGRRWVELARLKQTQSVPIVCICGSTKFKQTWIFENARLTGEGNIVLAVGLWGHYERQFPDEKTKAFFGDLHKRKIDLCDWVWILDVDGYVGESTRSEIEYAEKHNKPVRFLSKEFPDYKEPIDPLQAEVDKLKRTTVCSYCGAIQVAAEGQDKLEMIIEHLSICQKHPVPKLLAEVEEWKSLAVAEGLKIEELTAELAAERTHSATSDFCSSEWKNDCDELKGVIKRALDIISQFVPGSREEELEYKNWIDDAKAYLKDEQASPEAEHEKKD
jgi:hypothetical protein